MRPATSALLVLVSAASGCGGARSRELAVTVLEPDRIACTAAGSGSFDKAGLGVAALAREVAWQEAADALPPRPVGRVLRVNEVEDTMHAWFEQGAGEATGGLAGVEAPGFLGPSEVYEGGVHDEYVEGTYEDLAYPTSAASERPTSEARPSLRARGVLTITIDGGGVLGRILRTDTDYSVRSAIDAPDTHIECTRSLAVEGAEQD